MVQPTASRTRSCLAATVMWHATGPRRKTEPDVGPMNSRQPCTASTVTCAYTSHSMTVQLVKFFREAVRLCVVGAVPSWVVCGGAFHRRHSLAPFPAPVGHHNEFVRPIFNDVHDNLEMHLGGCLGGAVVKAPVWAPARKEGDATVEGWRCPRSEQAAASSGAGRRTASAAGRTECTPPHTWHALPPMRIVLNCPVPISVVATSLCLLAGSQQHGRLSRLPQQRAVPQRIPPRCGEDWAPSPGRGQCHAPVAF